MQEALCSCRPGIRLLRHSYLTRHLRMEIPRRWRYGAPSPACGGTDRAEEKEKDNDNDNDNDSDNDADCDIDNDCGFDFDFDFDTDNDQY